LATLLKVYAPAVVDVVVATVVVPLVRVTVAAFPPVPLIVPETVKVCTAELKAGTVALAPFTLTAWLAGVKVNPAFAGVTV
jgi:hypothetical protein